MGLLIVPTYYASYIDSWNSKGLKFTYCFQRDFVPFCNYFCHCQICSHTKLTVEEAAAQAFIFFLAGFETTSTTISFALFEMAQNQEIQSRAREEVRNIKEKCGGLIYESIMEMHYLDTILFGKDKSLSNIIEKADVIFC